MLDTAPPGTLALWASLALDSGGAPVVAYRSSEHTDSGLEDVIVARCTDPACTSEALAIERW